VIDRLPPQSLEAEESVLGSILIDRDAIVEVAPILKPDDFYRAANGSIYRAMLDLYERREPVDIVTVAETLERTEDLEAIGGRTYLSSLANKTPTAVHAVPYARIVERKAVLRPPARSPGSATRTLLRSRRRSTARRASCSQ